MMMMFIESKKIVTGIFLIFFWSLPGSAQYRPSKIPTRQDTLKGTVTAERSWWDVQRYDLSITPDYSDRTVKGCNTITYKTTNKRSDKLMQIDLQAPLKIDSVKQDLSTIHFLRDGDAWFIDAKKGNVEQQISIWYSGSPRTSTAAPWDGGVVWTADSLGRPWISVACQLSGASVWYPCKVHLGDEPDQGASITITCADSLQAVGNGNLTTKSIHPDGTTSFRWEVINPINNYCLTFYIGKYVSVSEVYKGEKGALDLSYWVLDYNKEKIRAYLHPEVLKSLKTFEYWFGPYPFYADGFKMVEAPYIGMEHQSAIAYGNKFRLGRQGLKRITTWDLRTDRMVVHESAHEWWGNNITAADMSDRWLHEGFAAFAEELQIEDLYGKEAGQQFFRERSHKMVGNTQPTILRYSIFEDGGEDMYMKSWIMIHMIRSMVHNDQTWRELLRGLNKTFYHKMVTTTEIENYIIKKTGLDLRTVFDQYLRDSRKPVLEYRLENSTLHYRLSNCVPELKFSLQTSWTDTNWLPASTEWRKITIKTPIQSEFRVGEDFYMELKNTSN